MKMKNPNAFPMGISSDFSYLVDDNGLEPLTLRTSIYGSTRKQTDYIIFHIFDSFLHCLYFWMGIPCGCFNIRMA